MTGRSDDLSRRALRVAAYALEHPIPQVGPFPVDDIDVLNGDSDARQHERWRQIIPARFLSAKLDDFEASDFGGGDVLANLRRWSVDPNGQNLVLMGPPGSGKTHAAIAAMRPAHDTYHDVVFWPLSELLQALRPPGYPGLLPALSLVERLVIDDLGSEVASDWTAEQLFILLNRRWLEELPTVVTTNLVPNELEERLGPRLFGRLRQEALAIQLVGVDRRAS